MKARWIRNAPDAMSALYETEGGPLPRYVAAFAEQDGTVTFYESNVDGGFKKVNALKGSGRWLPAENLLAKLGYVVTKGGLTLYPDGHEHAPRLDREEARAAVKAVAIEQSAQADRLFAVACRALLEGRMSEFENSFLDGAYAVEVAVSAHRNRASIEDAEYDAEASQYAHEIVSARSVNLTIAARSRAQAAIERLCGARIPNSTPVVARNSSPTDLRVGDVVQPNARWGVDAVDAYTREIDRMNVELAAKQLGVKAVPIRDPRETFKYNADDSPLYIGKNRAPGLCTLTPEDPKPGVYIDIARATAPTPSRPLWERALEAGSPDAPQVNHCSDLWIGRGLAAFRFGEITIPMDMVGNRATWDEMAMEVYRAWLALKPGEQILNYIGRRSWRASTVVRPEVLP